MVYAESFCLHVILIFFSYKDGLCPIHIAAHYGNVEATEVLLAKGVDTDSRARVRQIDDRFPF